MYNEHQYTIEGYQKQKDGSYKLVDSAVNDSFYNDLTAWDDEIVSFANAYKEPDNMDNDAPLYDAFVLTVWFNSRFDLIPRWSSFTDWRDALCDDFYCDARNCFFAYGDEFTYSQKSKSGMPLRFSDEAIAMTMVCIRNPRDFKKFVQPDPSKLKFKKYISLKKYIERELAGLGNEEKKEAFLKAKNLYVEIPQIKID